VKQFYFTLMCVVLKQLAVLEELVIIAKSVTSANKNTGPIMSSSHAYKT